MKKLILLIFGIFFIGLVSATWSNNTFNNSLATENITFTGNENFTRWLSVPENTLLTNAFMNLSGYAYINYTFNGTVKEWSSDVDATTCLFNDTLIFDEDWNTYGYMDYISDGGCSSSHYMRIYYNYSKPVGYQTDGNIKQIRKLGGGYENVTIPSTCIEAYPDVVSFFLNMRSHGETYGYCYNGSAWQSIEFYDNDAGYISIVYETAMFWVNNFYPDNTSLFLNNTQIWNHSGEFNSTFSPNKTSNFATTINNYISTATAVAGYFLVPFLFHSDTAGILEYLNLRFDNDGIFENSQTYNSSTYETSEETLSLNLSYDSSEWSSISSTLYYNGTSYLGTISGSGDTKIASKTIDIPLVSTQTNVTFYWTISLTNSTNTYNYNSTSNNQTIENLIFSICNATYDNPTLVNFSIYNEDNLTLMNSNMDSTFTYWLGNGDLTEEYSYDSSSDNTNFAFCSNVNLTFNVDSVIKIEATDYDSKTYYFNDDIFTNSTTYKNLYLINSSYPTDIIIEVKDTGLQPVVGYYVTIKRYYPEDGTYKEVGNYRTDDFGQFVASLIEDTVAYQFVFKDTGNNILKETGDIYVTCRSIYCVLPFVIETVGDEFDEFDDITDYEFTLSFDNSTNIFIYSWNDLTGESTTTRLEVVRYLINGSTIVCNFSSTASTDSLTCNVGSQKASYKAQAFRKVSGDERRIAILNAEVGSLVSIFGVEGLIWVFILLMTTLALGAYNPTAGAVMYGCGFVMFGLFDLISMPIEVFIANILIVAIFIWAVNRK